MFLFRLILVVVLHLILSTVMTFTVAFPLDAQILPETFLPNPVEPQQAQAFWSPSISGLQPKKRSLSIQSPNSNSHEIKQLSLEIYDDEDSCTGKGDAYFPNYGSNCTSYYFCTAGFQTTYLCKPGLRFNGLKCTRGYECPMRRGGDSNPCASSPNGYYANGRDPSKYFYCYHKSKVIELRCSGGKIYDDTQKKCLLKSEGGTTGSNEEGSGCDGKGNGFYPDLGSGCAKYYYCIDGLKTELECQGGLVFNGDLCVQEGSFKCPKESKPPLQPSPNP